MQGLGQLPDPNAGLAQQSNPMRDVNQIVMMLKEGVSPEELLQMGIPQELVAAALDMITQESVAVAPEQAGLAGMQLQ
jgi:hypothetical protein